MVLRRLLTLATASICSIGILCHPAKAQENDDFLSRIAKLELEELLQIEITSVLRKEQKLSRAPAAVYVLTAEEIRRAGATSIAEALRLVPGVNVARSSSGEWAIQSRGFDFLGATKMLVLIDGRTVYSPFFSGVFWDIQDVVLEDIERIEVIRGPGAVTWGENAVNGVVNIITKSSADTQGVLVSGGGGKEEKAFGTVRYGGAISEDTTYRIYAKGFERDEFRLSDGSEADDNWDQLRGGFRVDSQLSSTQLLTVQGDVYDGESFDQQFQLVSLFPAEQALVRNRTSVEGHNLLVRYTDDLALNSQLTAQAFYDYAGRSDFVSHEYRHLFELDVQHHITLSERHDLVYGTTYRFSSDDMGEGLTTEWDPSERQDHLITVFAQDEITLIPDTLSIIPGTKLGYNDYSGFEAQPALKSVWSMTPTETLWGSVSRAVRIPSRLNSDVRLTSVTNPLPDGTPVLVGIAGDKGVEAEDLLAYELGFRTEPFKHLSFDVATFYNVYDDLNSLEFGDPVPGTRPGPPHLLLPITFDNQINGESYGIEIGATWRAFDFATFSATYSHIQLDLDLDPGSTDMLTLATERNTPHNMATLRGHFNLPWNLEFDALLYYVDSVPVAAASSYIRTDMRLGWNATEYLTLDIIGQNIFDDMHIEQIEAPPVEVERAVFGRATFRFS